MASKVSSKRVHVARCRVCHRELRDAAAIAAGIGSVCAAQAAAARARTETAEAQVAGYPAEKYARIQRGAAELAESISYYDMRLQGAKIARNAADVARYTRRAAWARRWYATWSRMEREAYRRMTAGARQAKRAS